MDCKSTKNKGKREDNDSSLEDEKSINIMFFDDIVLCVTDGVSDRLIMFWLLFHNDTCSRALHELSGS